MKIKILSQDLQNRTTITEYIFELPLTISLRHLRFSLKSNGIIPNECTGRFKLPNRVEIEVEKEEEILIHNLAPTYEIFYLKTATLSTHLINIFFMKMEPSEGNKSMSYVAKDVIKEPESDKDEKSSLIEFAESDEEFD